MTSNLLLYVGSVIITLWGIAHIAPTGSIVKGFGEISIDNKRIITMEWVAEGLTLVFIGLLVLFLTLLGGAQNSASLIVHRVSAVMLLVMSGLSLLTGARTSIVPMKICPLVKITVAILFLLGSVL
ncbi:MAG: hypothetical protein JSV84_09000 [Gemmatimonadota bacterium]|nr:MAG: hypothetical protein JSV84_09000 [Gemmatimonadota bacterium]